MGLHKGEIDPKLLLEATISVERNLAIMTGPELISRYSTGDSALVFEHVTGKPVTLIALDHNPFWHYCLQTWYKRHVYRGLLHPPRHRDEAAKAVLMLCTG